MTNEELDEARAKEARRIWRERGGEHLTFAVIAARLAREGWTPPEPVDPDVLAFREWARGFFGPADHRKIDAGEWDRSTSADIFRAGVRYARGEKA